MIKRLKKITQSIVSLGEDRRHQHFIAFTITGLPLMLVFGLLNIFVYHDYWQLFFIVPIFISLIISLFILKRRKRVSGVYRFNTVLFGSLLLYMLTTGGTDGSKLQWMYIYPLIIYFLLGRQEGKYWNIITFASALVVFINPAGLTFVYPYPQDTIIRFLLSYFCVTLITHWFEYHRETYRKKLEEQTGELRKALDEVKTLKGYLPVCASCKKVREKDGSWIDLEKYIENHSDAEISHGLCDECAQKLYPSIMEKITKEEKSQ